MSKGEESETASNIDVAAAPAAAAVKQESNAASYTSIDGIMTKCQLRLSRGTKTEVIPIRADIDLDGVRCVDSFMWEVNETRSSPELIAARALAEGLNKP